MGLPERQSGRPSIAALSLYQASVPTLRRGLVNLRACLVKGAAHFADRGGAEAEWLAARLAPDMYPLLRQVQMASDAVKFGVSRLAGAKDAPVFPDEETKAAELLARIDATLAYVDGVAPAAIDGREDATILVETPRVTIRFTGAGYLRDFVLPNFFFHCSMTYALLRSQGVPLGKLDFLGPMDLTREP